VKYFKGYANHKLITHMKKYGFRSPVLEIGCGAGETLEAISKSHDVKGVDLSDKAIEICRKKGLNAHKADAVFVKTEKPYNSLICMDILEHIEDDHGFVRHLYELLDLGGKLYIQVPSGSMMKDDIAYGHYRRYSKHSIVELLEKCNFSVLHAEMLGYPILYYIRLFMNLICKINTGDADLKKATLRSSYDNPFDKNIFAKLLGIKWISAIASKFMLLQNAFSRGEKGSEVIVIAEKKE